MMTRQQQDEFWRLYELHARGPIEQACRRASRALSESTMDVFDMIAWVDDRVWRMLRHEQAPTFHDCPAPDVAIERLIANARTLARWSYLALSRKHWRRLERRQDIVAAMSRTERLAAVEAQEVPLEKSEELRQKLEKIRDSVSRNVRTRAAASWHDPAERHRIALALGATEPEDTALIEKTMTGEIKTNTVEQMRSRALRRLREVAAEAAKSTACFVAVALVVIGLLTADEAFAGEQSGGRGGGKGMIACQVDADWGSLGKDEQSGRRGSKGMSEALAKGEQSGGRGGH
ncbi:MAG: hypothetical protein DYG94_05595 [Leptolyngbya sp. PLA3]|nr:MAG: hypothetical protein EDM82_04525 [Cyanobacteria bacterium CYA]MCE7968207.1 hypothetical protein [Leptolyngbya sp. PL-A3]